MLHLSTPWALAQGTRADGPSASPLADRVVPLEATVNGQLRGVWPFVERSGELYVGRDAIDDWRLILPAGLQPIVVRGQEYWPLRDFPGFALKVNYAMQSVDINFAPEAFVATRLVREMDLPSPSPVLPSVYLNYDVNFQAAKARGQQAEADVGTLLEFGTSSAWGVFTSSHVGRSITSAQNATWARLESTFTRHMPGRNMTLRLGDAATRAGLWGNSVYFAGLQVGSNYALVPGFLTQPLPLIGGVSAAPSTVQLYVNDVLRKTSQVPAGPFVVDDVTGLSGAGETRLVIRDVLGREVVIVQRFFTSGQLLAPELADWSLEVGWPRENLGASNADYGSRFLSGTYRRGLTHALTLEGRGEISRHAQTAGVGGIVALPYDVLARAALAASTHDQFGPGGKYMLGLERQWTRTALFLQAQGATRRYAELGRDPSRATTRREWAANLATSIGNTGQRLGVNVVGIARHGGQSVTTLSLNYSVPLPRRSALTMTVSRAFGISSGTLVGASLNIPLEDQRQLQATATRHRAALDFHTSVNQSSLRDLDFGWRALAGRFQNEAHAEAGVYYGGRYGRVFTDLSGSASQTALRAGVTGGLVWAAGHPFLTQRVDQSFAVVEVKGIPDVGVGLGSTITTRTNSEGIALVPYLTPYQVNQVRLHAPDLPVSAEISSIEMTAVPAWRSAVKIDFPVRTGRAALIRLVFDDGEPAAAGGIVQIEGDSEEFYVARRGEAYVTGLQPENRLRLRWNGQTCGFELKLPPATGDEVARLGPIVCGGMQR